METVYLETSFISYLVSEPSKNIVTLHNQLQTRAWWKTHSKRFQFFVSDLVLLEASRGRASESIKRVEFLRTIPMLRLTKEELEVAKSLVDQVILPEIAFDDAAHIVCATAHQLDYLLTWNCKHIANPRISSKIETFLLQRYGKVPMLCSPLQL